jgi:hypothetical protein
MVLLGASLLLWTPYADATEPEDRIRETHIRAGTGRTIVAVQAPPRAAVGHVSGTAVPYPHPRPRLAGFSPMIAITTSNQGHPLGHDLEFEHDLEGSYVGSPLNPLADPGYVLGYLDSGSDVDLAAGTFADALGLFGANLTPNSIEIGGVGGFVDADITMPVGFFAAGLSAVDESGTLDYDALVGHSNACGLAAPTIDCGNGEILTAVAGTPFMAFYNSVIRVDTPRTATFLGQTIIAPDVQIQDPFDSLPTFSRRIAMEFGSALSPMVTTANYYVDFGDLETPILPTLVSLGPGLIPSGGAFFATIYVVKGEPGPTNPVQPMRVLVDTGAQSSIMSSGMVSNLSLPSESDFTVDVCGVGGLVTGVQGYYVDYVKINATGGALEFSRAPFVVLDLPSAEGGTLDGILGMNFFWNRNVIFEPVWGVSGLSTGVLHVSQPVPFAYGDFDLDFDVDPEDEATFVSCATGPATGLLTVDCDHIDQDLDGDVDLRDFGRFQVCHTDFDVPAAPSCGE